VKIRELFRAGRPLVSFEFFPPRTPEGEVGLMRTIEALRPLQPAFVSVTRTGGKPREASVEIGTRVRDLGIEAAAHVTCIEASRDDIARHCELALSRGIQNFVTIRGDRPPDPDFRSPADGFTYAVDMIRFIKERGYDICLLGAGHPEGHPECRDLDLGIQHLKMKVDAGLDVVVTQLFYDNDDFFRFVDRARKAGIQVPIVAGFMPITNVAQIRRITQLSGNQIPPALSAALDEAKDDPERAMAVGIEHGTRQCAALVRGGVAGIHFYTLNQSPATRAIFENLRGDGLLGA
jgi:methylenetetrahydrofolate reductase (NADPH)